MFKNAGDRCADCVAEPACPFSELSPEAREAFQSITETRIYAPGSSILRQGDPALGLFIVQAGLVRVLHLTPAGKPVGVRMASGAEILGLNEVITGDRYRQSAEAVEQTRLEYVPRKRFVPFLFQHPEVAVEVLIRVSQDFAKLQEGLYEAAAGSPLGDRLLHKLQEFAGSCGVPTDRGVMLDVPLTVQDLAGTLGCSRQWASKLLAEIESQGLIERNGRRITLTGDAVPSEPSPTA